MTRLFVLQLPEVHTNSCDNISQFSVDSITSLESKEPVFIAAGDIRSVLQTYSVGGVGDTLAC